MSTVLRFPLDRRSGYEQAPRGPADIVELPVARVTRDGERLERLAEAERTNLTGGAPVLTGRRRNYAEAERPFGLPED
jgi:hypothetical protein